MINGHADYLDNPVRDMFVIYLFLVFNTSIARIGPGWAPL